MKHPIVESEDLGSMRIVLQAYGLDELQQSSDQQCHEEVTSSSTKGLSRS